MLIKGRHLTEHQKRLVLNAFVNRFTGEHKPQWANKKMPNGEEYKPLYKTDDEWINDYSFYFIKDGSRLMANKNYCVPTSTLD
jgi:hypothetical protein